MTYVLIASAALGGILLFLLAAATANSPLFAEHYPLLLGLNAAIALALLGLVVYQLTILARQRPRWRFESLASGCRPEAAEPMQRRRAVIQHAGPQRRPIRCV